MNLQSDRRKLFEEYEIEKIRLIIKDELSIQDVIAMIDLLKIKKLESNDNDEYNLKQSIYEWFFLYNMDSYERFETDRIKYDIKRFSITKLYMLIARKLEYEKNVEDYEIERIHLQEIQNNIETNWIALKNIQYYLERDFFKTGIWKILNPKKIQKLRYDGKQRFEIINNERQELLKKLNDTNTGIASLKKNIKNIYNEYIETYSVIDELINQMSASELKELVEYLKISINSTNDNYFNQEDAFKEKIKGWFNIKVISFLESSLNNKQKIKNKTK